MMLSGVSDVNKIKQRMKKKIEKILMKNEEENITSKVLAGGKRTEGNDRKHDRN